MNIVPKLLLTLMMCLYSLKSAHCGVIAQSNAEPFPLALFGEDLDHNSVRDDVDNAIANMADSQAQHLYLVKYAQLSSQILLHRYEQDDYANLLFANDLYDEITRLRMCSTKYDVDGKDAYDLTNKLNRVIYNTEDRILAYLQFEKYIMPSALAGKKGC